MTNIQPSHKTAPCVNGHAVALRFRYHNLARIRQTLRLTPAMGAAVADHVWTSEALGGPLHRTGKEIATMDPQIRGTVASKPVPEHNRIAFVLFNEDTLSEVSCLSSPTFSPSVKIYQGEKIILAGDWAKDSVEPRFIFNSVVR